MNTPLFANPTQFGSSGLLNVPSADTLDSANFCFGVWGNCSSKSETGMNSIMPVTLTLGVGTFWEVYGTYPNVLLNSDAPDSGRGTADLGMKLRVIGSRSSKFKLALDAHLSRYIDDDQKYNGVTDTGGGIIATLRSDNFGAHLYSGYMSNGDSRAVEAANPTKSTQEFPVATGVEFSPSVRSRATIEFTAADASSPDAPMEATAGFQYYLTPHLTLNLAGSMGLNDAAADWRVLFGLSTCQGVGAYIKPIPVVKRKGDNGDKAEVIRPTKIVVLSPILIKTPALTTPINKFEVPVDSEGEEILIRPYANIVLPQQPVSLPKVVAEAKVTPLYGVSVKGEVASVEKLAAPVTTYRKFRLPDNLLEFDNAEMVPEVQKSLAELAEFIRKDTKWIFLRIDGHTDGVGSVKYNIDLSLKRAIAVANYLISKEGIDPERIFLRGMGKSAPLADNSSEEGRRLNRRIEIVFLAHKDEKKQ